MSLDVKLAALATRLTSEFNSVRTALSGKASTGHTHSPSAVYAAPRTDSATGTYSADGTTAGDIQLTCTGNTVITPTGTPNGRAMVIECLASGAQRSVSVATGVALPQSGGPVSRSLTVPQNALGRFALYYSALEGSWILQTSQVV